MAQFSNQTLRDICTRALQLLYVAPSGNTPTDQMVNDALYVANEILDSWSANGMMIYTQTQNFFPLPTAKQVWTIGPVTAGMPTPDFIVPARPNNLQSANMLLTTASPTLEIPLQILSDQEWANIRTKTIYTTIVNKIYMDEQWPIANIYLWPIPSGGDPQLILWYWQLFNSALTLDSIISLPPGYAKLLRYGICMNLAPEYNKPIPADIAGVYAALKRDIEIKNIRPSSLYYSAAAQGTGISGNYNILNDTTE